MTTQSLEIATGFALAMTNGGGSKLLSVPLWLRKGDFKN